MTRHVTRAVFTPSYPLYLFTFFLPSSSFFLLYHHHLHQVCSSISYLIDSISYTLVQSCKLTVRSVLACLAPLPALVLVLACELTPPPPLFTFTFLPTLSCVPPFTRPLLRVPVYIPLFTCKADICVSTPVNSPAPAAAGPPAASAADVAAAALAAAVYVPYPYLFSAANGP